jgi:hypothetical protein
MVDYDTVNYTSWLSRLCFLVFAGRSYTRHLEKIEQPQERTTYCRVDVRYNTALRDDYISEQLAQPEDPSKPIATIQ